MPLTDRDRLLSMAGRRASFSARQAAATGLHSQHLTRLVRDGTIERIARGRYRFAQRAITEHHGLAVAAAAVPRGVVCLLSALSFHEIGSQLPAEVWIAIERRGRAPALAYPPIRYVRFSGAAFTEGVEVHDIEGEHVLVYSVAKTVSDLFRYRNKLGLDVALEALREAWRDQKFVMDDLDLAARVCRVERVMRPYVEALLS